METLFHHPTLQRAWRTSPSIAAGLLMMLLAIMLATLVWQVLTPTKTIPIAPASAAKNPNSPVPNQPINYGNDIAKHHLFGEEKKQVKTVQATVATKPTVTPKTQLSLVLLGILDRSPKKSYAIIAPKQGGEQKFHSVGDEPQAGVIITSIRAREITLKYNGKSEVLKIPETQLNAVTSTRRGNSNASLPKALPPATSPLPLAIPVSPQEGGALSPKAAAADGKKSEVSAEGLGQLRDAIINNPAKLLEIASVTERKDKEGNLLGFRLSPGKNRALFRQLGLRPGDVVTSVNGIQLDSTSKGLGIMGELQGAESINMIIQRAGQEVSISKSF